MRVGLMHPAKADDAVGHADHARDRGKPAAEWFERLYTLQLLPRFPGQISPPVALSWTREGARHATLKAARLLHQTDAVHFVTQQINKVNIDIDIFNIAMCASVLRA
jgi:hypothetical protein